MSDLFNLKDLEKRAFRSTYQDGLLDINYGLVIMSMSVLSYSNSNDQFPIFRFALFICGLLLGNLVYWGGKKFLTSPRLGNVKFGPRRKQRAKRMTIILSGIVFLQVLMVIGTILLWMHPEWASKIGLSGDDADRERLMVAMIGVLFVGPSTAIIAYFTDFVRGYYISILLAIGVFSLIWFDQPMFLTITGFLILIPGVILLIRFLQQYPLPPTQVLHE